MLRKIASQAQEHTTTLLEQAAAAVACRRLVDELARRPPKRKRQRRPRKHHIPGNTRGCAVTVAQPPVEKLLDEMQASVHQDGDQVHDRTEKSECASNGGGGEEKGMCI